MVDSRHTGDWKDGGRANRQEEDKTDKGRKKLVAPLPPNLCGITGVPKADAKADSREIESCTEMQVRIDGGFLSYEAMVPIALPMASLLTCDGRDRDRDGHATLGGLGCGVAVLGTVRLAINDDISNSTVPYGF